MLATIRSVSIVALFVASMLSSTATATIIRVPLDQSTIQAGIDSAQSSDTVLVSESTYYERITFDGKNITVASNFLLNPTDSGALYNTIINGDPLILGSSDTGSVVRFVDSEDSTALLVGFTVTGGTGVVSAEGRCGGGIYNANANPRVAHCIIVDNVADIGGGLYCRDATVVQYCLIDSNSAAVQHGGGAALAYARLSLVNCRVTNNNGCAISIESAGQDPGSEGIVVFDHCHVANNSGGISNHASQLDGPRGTIVAVASTLVDCPIEGSQWVDLSGSTLFASDLAVWNYGVISISDSKLWQSHVAAANEGRVYIDSSLIDGLITISGNHFAACRIRNSTLLGSGIDMTGDNFGLCELTMMESIVSTEGGPAIKADPTPGHGGDSITVACCVVRGYDSAWLTGIPLSLDTDNVLFVDPLFCNPADSNYNIDSLSPCAAYHPQNPCSALIGAYPPRCQGRADTVIVVSSLSGCIQAPLVCSLRVQSAHPLAGVTLPLALNPCDMSIDSVSYLNTAVENWDLKFDTIASCYVLIGLIADLSGAGPSPLPAGNHLLAKVYATRNIDCDTHSIGAAWPSMCLDTAFWDVNNQLRLFDDALPPTEYSPQFVTGCDSQRHYLGGDFNCNCVVNSGDIIATVGYVFKSGPYSCKPFADCSPMDCTGDCVITAADIICLVNYVFKSGPVPACSICE